MFVFTFSLYVKLSIKSGSIEVIYLELHKPKNTADKDSRYENFGTHVEQWTGRVHYDTLDLGAMILHEIESVLGPLKYTSFFKVQSLKLMENHGPINEKLLGLKAKKFFFVGP